MRKVDNNRITLTKGDTLALENDYYGLAKNTTYRFIIAYSEEG